MIDYGDEGEEEDEKKQLLVILAGMEAELKEFGFHGDSGDAEPAGSLGLVALGKFNGAGEDFAFGIFQDASVDVANFTAARRSEEFVDVITKGHRRG